MSFRKLLGFPLIWDLIHPVSQWRIVTALQFPRNLSSVERRKQFPGQKLHDRLFDLIFNEYGWAKDAIESYKAHLFLIGKDLDKLYYGSSSNDEVYLMIFADDISGDLRYSKNSFLTSLKHHRHVSPHELYFPTSRLTLNVYNIFFNTESSSVDPQRLFSGKKARKLRTKYLCWNDQGTQPSTISIREMKGPYLELGGREAIRRAADPRFYCIMNLKCSGKSQVECMVKSKNEE